MSLFEKDEYTVEDIQSLIDNQVEESAHLDFKEGRALDNNDRKKGEIAKDVSAFANSDGGIIIYGISERGHKASSLSFVDGDTFTKEWLEQIISSNINQRIDDVRIFPIRFDNDTKKTIYVVKIPRSVHAPHMSSDNRYYHRFNFISAPMEEYEVRDLFYRVNKSHLDILGFYLKRDDDYNDEESVSIQLFTKIGNISSVTETVYKLNYYLTAPEGLLSDTIVWEPQTDRIDYYHWKNGMKVSALGTMPLFPDEQIELGRFRIRIKRDYLEPFFDNTQIRVLLFYSGGFSENTIPINSFYEQLFPNGIYDSDFI